MSWILFLSQLVPYPLDAGPKIRSYYVLRHLSQKHKVTLLAFTRPDDTPEAVQHLREFCEDIHLIKIHRSQIRKILNLAASLLVGKSFIIRRDHVSQMVHLVDRLLLDDQFDVVHTDQLWMAQYALQAKRVTTGVKLVLDEHNACFQVIHRLAAGEHNLIKRLLLSREWRILRAYEAQNCACFDHVVTVTEQDRAVLHNLIHSEKRKARHQFPITTHQNITTIPICVDTQSIAPVRPILGAMNILHLGTMFWLPNVEGVLWFAKDVWPKIAAQVPNATFTIAGKNPPAEIQALSNMQNVNSPIDVTGYVPDPQTYLERTAVFIVPLLSGGGMRVKIIDAWRWGLPIVSTSIGAEGISTQPGENILIADDPDAFAQAVVKVLQEPLLAERLRVNGRKWVEEHYDWRKVYEDWDSVYTTSKT